MVQTLKEVMREFDKTIADASTIVQFANTAFQQRKIKKDQTDRLIESAFLHIYVSWERFLEDSFVLYLSGRSINGFKPRKFIKKIDKQHAFKLLVREQDYIEWTNITDVKERAEIFFYNGEPYVSSLVPVETQLNEMKKIRNRIAHSSDLAKYKFEKLVNSKAPNKNRQMPPGEFLMLFGSSRPRRTYYETYVSCLEFAKKKILNMP